VRAGEHVVVERQRLQRGLRLEQRGLCPRLDVALTVGEAMKRLIIRASALAAAAAFSGMIACGSSSGCGQSTSNPTSNTASLTQGVSMTCGAGTTQVGTQCVANSQTGH